MIMMIVLFKPVQFVMNFSINLQVATKLDKFRTYEQIVDEKDSGFFQKDHTIHQCFDWLVFKIFYKSVIFSKNNGFF